MGGNADRQLIWRCSWCMCVSALMKEGEVTTLHSGTASISVRNPQKADGKDNPRSESMTQIMFHQVENPPGMLATVSTTCESCSRKDIAHHFLFSPQVQWCDVRASVKLRGQKDANSALGSLHPPHSKGCLLSATSIFSTLGSTALSLRNKSSFYVSGWWKKPRRVSRALTLFLLHNLKSSPSGSCYVLHLKIHKTCSASSWSAITTACSYARCINY